MPREQKLNVLTRILLSSALFFLLVAHPTIGQGSNLLRVVTTSTIVADLAHQIAGDRATVVSLVRIGADPHTFQPLPSDLEFMTEADVVLIHGFGIDRRMADMATQTAVNGIVRTVTDGLTPRDGDPHFWFDPHLVRTYVQNIAEALVEADPAGAEFYEANATNYQEQLDQLDRWIRARVEEIPADRRKLVTNHDTLRYFADRYGFEVVGSVFANPDPDTQPSARQISELVRNLKDAGVHVLFTETTLSPRLVHTVARELGDDVHVVQLYTDSLSSADGPASTYLEFMRYNVDRLVPALKADSD